MKKLVFILLCSLNFLGCKQETPKHYTVEEQIMIDSIKNDLMHKADVSIWEKSKTTDTIGVYLSPIKVISASIVDSESGSYRNVRLNYQNVSDKNIIAIKFQWKGENAFFEPADLGSSFIKGYGAGFTDDLINPGKTTTSTWSVYSRDAKTVEAWPTEVVFSDKTKWFLKK